MVPFLGVILSILSISLVDALDNGLALTPPMGWMSWQRFRCTINCEIYPHDCISEKLFREMADRMVEDGFLEAGYKYLIIDDCWLANERDENGRLQPDSKRFPNGIKSLADYVHKKGLKFGIYEDYGTKTCAGYPGMLGHLETDANTFAEWEVDFLKVDGCNAPTYEGMENGYAELGRYLNKTGRPIMYSCSFPAYKGLQANYSAAVEICNLWRNYNDLQDSWAGLRTVVDWFSDNQNFITQFAGPGHWNDPDNLIIGNFGLSYDESVAQMTIWSVLAAPLIMSVDFRTIKPEFKHILLNKNAIRINQDPLGIPGLLKLKWYGIYVWSKPILPKVEGKFSHAVAVVNFRDDVIPYRMKIKLPDLGLDGKNKYLVKDVFRPVETVKVSGNDSIYVFVNPSGAVLLELCPIL